MPGRVEISGLTVEGTLAASSRGDAYLARLGSRPVVLELAPRGGRVARWFRRDAVMLARVDHAGVPAVLEVGEQDGRAYAILERVEGETLAHRLERSPLGLGEVLKLGCGLARTLDAVHRRGLVHRALSSTRVLLQPDGSARLVGFGLGAHQTVSLELVSGEEGPEGSAPEQRDPTRLVDGRADLYALGRVLEGCLASLKPSVPAPVQQVLAALGSEAPEDRYPTGAGLAEDLNRLLGGQPPRGPAPGGPLVPRESSVTVGREEELARLERAWDAAMSGRGSVWLLDGMAGSGKSHLLRRLEDSRASHLVVHADGGNSAPLASIGSLVEGCVAHLDELGATEAERLDGRVTDLLNGPLGGALARLAPGLLSRLPEGAPPKLEPDAFVEAAAQVILELLELMGPALVVVDDLQWLDAASREILIRVALGVSKAPVLLVAAARTEAVSRAGPERFIRVLGSRRLEVLRLPPLDDDQIGQLVVAQLGRRPVDDAVRSRVVGLSNGTPLGILEVLGALLDGAAVVPRQEGWVLDRAVAEAMPLPRSTRALVERRLSELPAATLEVLRVAGMIGRTIDAGVVAEVVGVREADVDLALVQAGRLGLVQRGEGGRPRFVHDSVSDALVVTLEPVALAELHQRIAEILDRYQPTDPGRLLRIAGHYLRGAPERTAGRTFEVACVAAREAARRQDHELAIRLFELAARCGELADRSMGPELFRAAAESQLRTGALGQGIESLERALIGADGLERASVLGRLAWAHQMGSDPERAWSALRQAFDALGVAMPEGKPLEVIRGLASRMWPPRVRRLALEGDRVAVRVGLLCELHYQNARLGFENQQPLRALAGALAILDLGEALGASATLSRAHAHYAGFMMILGRGRAADRYLARALEIAEGLGDRAAVAHAQQTASVMACFRGELDQALKLSNLCLDAYGPWLEVTEYCLIVANARLLETLRGRARVALDWTERAEARVQRARVSPAVLQDLLRPALDAAHASLGARPSEPIVAGRHRGGGSGRGVYRLASWGPRALYLYESGAPDRELEALVAEFESEGYGPRTVHPAVFEYYVVVAYARVRQAVSASSHARRGALKAVDEAVRNVRLSARIDLFRAHLLVLEGHVAALRGRVSRARNKFLEARRLGEKEGAPWVQAEAALGEARILLRQGMRQEAIRWGEEAVELHLGQGAAAAADRIRAELGLDGAAKKHALGDGAELPGVRRLSAVQRLHVAAAERRTLRDQSRVVLDVVLEAVGADRGLLLFSPEPGDAARLLAGRIHTGADWTPGDGQPFEILRRVAEAEPEIHADGSATSQPLVGGRSVVLQLRLHGDPVGALHLERAQGAAPFSAADVEFVGLLATPIPGILELARALEERDQLQRELQRSRQLEALGRLAGGVVHDVNNMLAAMMNALALMEEGSEQERHLGVDTLRESTRRIADLCGQLLQFSRQQAGRESLVDLDDVVGDIRRILERLVGPDIQLDVRPAAGPSPVEADVAGLEQALINLVVNARDAMAGHGRVTIEVGQADLDASWRSRGASRMGAHAVVRVRDDGPGMSPDVLERAFEPFFTTKPRGQGTGMGLATVQGFVTQSGGCVDVHSEVGVGTTVSLYLPMATRPAEQPTPRRATRASVDGRRILVVDDELMVRLTIEACLEQHGHSVEVVADARQALQRLAGGEAVDLVITDVWMPGMTGTELVRRIRASGASTAALMLSGHSLDELVERDATVEGVEVLTKPFVIADLVAAVDRAVSA